MFYLYNKFIKPIIALYFSLKNEIEADLNKNLLYLNFISFKKFFLFMLLSWFFLRNVGFFFPIVYDWLLYFSPIFFLIYLIYGMSITGIYIWKLFLLQKLICSEKYVSNKLIFFAFLTSFRTYFILGVFGGIFITFIMIVILLDNFFLQFITLPDARGLSHHASWLDSIIGFGSNRLSKETFIAEMREPRLGLERRIKETNESYLKSASSDQEKDQE